MCLSEEEGPADRLILRNENFGQNTESLLRNKINANLLIRITWR